MTLPEAIVRFPLLGLLVRWTALFALGWIIQALVNARHPRLRMVLWRSILSFALVVPLGQFFPLKVLKIPLRTPTATLPAAAEPLQYSPPGSTPTPAATAAESRPAMPSASTASTGAKLVAVRPWRPPIDWKRSLCAFWAFGCAFGLIRLGRLQVQLARVRTRAASANPELQGLVKKIGLDLAIKRTAELRLSAQTGSPFLCGLIRPVILLPTAIVRELSPGELAALLSHELAHLRHRDLLWCVGWRYLSAVFWFHPLVWRIPAAHNFACEEEADRLAAGQGEHSAFYSQSLARLTLRVLSLPSLETELSLNGASQIARRLKCLRRRRIDTWNWKYSLAGFAVAAVTCLVAVASGLSQADEAASSRANRSASAPTTPPEASPATSQDSSTPALSKGIHSRLIDREGRPIPNAYVQCQGVAWSQTTDQRGRFSWNGQEQPRTFEIKKRGYKTLFTALLQPSEHEVVLTMEAAPVISGKVIDKETRQPIASFRVYHVRTLQGPVIPWLEPHENLTGSAGSFEYSFANFFTPDSALYIDAYGYTPVLSRPLTKADAGTELAFELSPAVPLHGVVLSPQGMPVEKAEVRLWCGELNMHDIPDRHRTQSDNHGSFTVPPILDGIVVASDYSGYAEIPWQEFAANGNIRLSEWGHVKGHWPKPLPGNRRVSIERINWSGEIATFPPPWKVMSTDVHSNGDFDFEDGAPAGEYMVTEWDNLRINYPGGGFSEILLASRRVALSVEAGRTTLVEVPSGRRVVGKFAPGDRQSLTNVHFPVVTLQLKQNAPESSFPPLDPSLSDTQQFERWKQHREQLSAFWLSDQGRALRRARRSYQVKADADGAFRIDNVPAGVYELKINAERWDGKQGSAVLRQVTVSDSPGGAPLDLGPLAPEDPSAPLPPAISPGSSSSGSAR